MSARSRRVSPSAVRATDEVLCRRTNIYVFGGPTVVVAAERVSRSRDGSKPAPNGPETGVRVAAGGGNIWGSRAPGNERQGRRQPLGEVGGLQATNEDGIAVGSVSAPDGAQGTA